MSESDEDVVNVGRPTRFPIDYAALKKGDVISTAELERMAGAPAGTTRFRTVALKLAQSIEKRRQLHAQVLENQVKVLTDAESSLASQDQVHKGFRWIRRRTKSFRRVDTNVLTLEQKQQYSDAEVRISRAEQAAYFAAYGGQKQLTMDGVTPQFPKRGTRALPGPSQGPEDGGK